MLGCVIRYRQGLGSICAANGQRYFLHFKNVKDYDEIKERGKHFTKAPQLNFSQGDVVTFQPEQSAVPTARQVEHAGRRILLSRDEHGRFTHIDWKPTQALLAELRR